MIINFECKRCLRTFDCDVGSVSLPENSDRPYFEKGLLCPSCGELTIDDVWLTELGQSQLTEATLDYRDDFLDSAESQCQGCDRYLSVNDLGLCDECACKLDRDLIRQRDWDYAVSAFGLDAAGREELHRQVIGQYGEKLELIAPSKEMNRKARRQRKKRKKKGRC
jgi:hypothetical protein